MIEQKLTVGGIALEVCRAGKGPPLLLLHGAMDWGRIGAMVELLGARFEVIAPSHPGFGRSPLPGHFERPEDLAYLYLDLLDQLELADVTLAGLCLGGWVAAEMAVRCTHRLARMVLVGAMGIKVGDRETRDIPDIFALPPNRVAELAYHDPARAAVDYRAMTDEELEIWARGREAAALYTWEPYMHNPRLRHWLHRISVPTMLVRGASDGLISQSYAEAYAGLIPGARLEVVPQAGHMPQIEQPESLAERIFAFAR